MSQTGDGTGGQRARGDNEAILAWAEALRTGMGLVRFRDLPEDQFEQILDGAARRETSFFLTIAHNTSLSNLDRLAHAFPKTPQIAAAIAARRRELIGLVDAPANVVAFPGTVAFPGADGTSAARAAAAREGMASAEELNLAKVRRRRKAAGFFSRMVALFNEAPTEFDDVEGEDVQIVRTQEDLAT